MGSRVKLEMESHGSIHLACHAIQDLDNPLKSGFFLHDGRLELSEIMKQKFTVRELAFLSACQTSTGTKKLSEEVVHLAAGMLAAGYQSVVATMWSIKDRCGPVVAESLQISYGERRGFRPTTTRYQQCCTVHTPSIMLFGVFERLLVIQKKVF